MTLKSFLQQLVQGGYKQTEIAAITGYKPQFINNLLRRTERESIITKEKFAKAFNLPITVFLDDQADIPEHVFHKPTH